MLPILSKDAQKQKEIAERAAKTVLESKAKAAQAKAAAASGKKVPMKIQAIPPFGGAAKQAKPAALPIPPTAGQDIKLATSPTPDAGAAATTAAATAKKLNPAASKFEFKPNAKAPAFNPGQSQSSANTVPSSTAGAGPSNSYSNPFFSRQPHNIVVDVRNDFVPWRHHQIAPAAQIGESPDFGRGMVG
jgi:hypothetical protein